VRDTDEQAGIVVIDEVPVEVAIRPPRSPERACAREIREPAGRVEQYDGVGLRQTGQPIVQEPIGRLILQPRAEFILGGRDRPGARLYIAHQQFDDMRIAGRLLAQHGRQLAKLGLSLDDGLRGVRSRSTGRRWQR